MCSPIVLSKRVNAGILAFASASECQRASHFWLINVRISRLETVAISRIMIAFAVSDATEPTTIFSPSDGDGSWADGWQKMSAERDKPKHVAGWTAGDKGSLMIPKPYQKLAGPWIDGKDPATIS